MSRPSSRLSTASYTSHEPAEVPGYSGNRVRASSSLSATSSTFPHTPGAGLSKRASLNAGARGLGLSAREFDRAAEAVRSVQRNQRINDIGPASDSTTKNGVLSRESSGRMAKGKGKASIAPDASFIPEASFIEAPLNARVNMHASPRRPVAKPSDGLKTAILDRKEPLTSTRLRQIITNNDSIEDDEADLQTYDQNEPEEPEAGLQRESLEDADLQIQEALLIQDLLGVLLGIEGQYIRHDSKYAPEDEYDRLQGARFVVDDEIDASLRELVERILPISAFYTAIQAFVEAHSHLDSGLTSHALCSAMREDLQQHLVLVAQLEEQYKSSSTFSIQRFHYFCQPMLHRLFLVRELIKDLTSSDTGEDTSTEEEEAPDGKAYESSDDEDDRFGGAALKAAMRGMRAGTDQTEDKSSRSAWHKGGAVKGGEILAIINERLQRTGGDPVAKAIYSGFLLKASQPYAHTLLQWISTGILADPYEEFMISEARSLHTTALDQDYVDEYWERKYMLRDAPLKSTTADLQDRGEDVTSLGMENGLLGQYGERGESTASEDRAQMRYRGLGGGAIIPSFLAPYKVKILLAGKYLNVIRECASSEVDTLTASMSSITVTEVDGNMSMQGDSFLARIDTAYLSANTALLTLLIQQQALFPRLRSLKHHFFLDQGDSFTHFLDLASHELSKKAKHVSLSKLQSLLDVSIRNPSSTSGADPYKEDVKVAMSSMTLTDWLMNINNVKGVNTEEIGTAGELPDSGTQDRKPADREKSPVTGIEALSFDYTVKFPLSLVLSRKAILGYQLLFRHLLIYKHLEQILTSNWLEHTKAPAWRKLSPHTGLERWKARVFTLRARMLAFAQQIFAYSVSEVLEANWRAMMSKLENIKTVDQLLKSHHGFLDTCLKGCMLTNNKLLKLNSRLVQTCTLFVAHASKFAKVAGKLNAAVELAIANGEEVSTVSTKEEEDFLQKFELNFYKHQKTHADTVMFHALSDTNALLPLVVRLANTVPETGGLAA